MAGKKGPRPASINLAPVTVRYNSIAHSVQVAGAIDGEPCLLTVDTASERTIVRTDMVPGRRLHLAERQLCGVTGHCTALEGPVEVTLTVGGAQVSMPAYVADIEEQCILGLDYLAGSGARVDFSAGILEFRGREVPLLMQEDNAQVIVSKKTVIPPKSEALVSCKLSKRMCCETGVVEAVPPGHLRHGLLVGKTLVRPGTGDIKVLVANVANFEQCIPAGVTVGTCEEVETAQVAPGIGQQEEQDVARVPEHLLDLLKRSATCLDKTQVTQLESLLCNYADVFSTGDGDLGRTGLVKHRIDTGGHPPIKHAPRRIAPARRKEMEAAVGELVEQGLVEKSSSPWSSAIVLVKKKDGSTRCCVDYPALNEVMVKDSYPLPRVDDTDALVGAQWFSTLDMKSGYHQVEMAEEDKAKTAFSFGQGLWQFKVMAFGLCNAPASFERLMEQVLKGLYWRTALVYLDDIIVIGKTFEQELERLAEVFRRFRDANLKLSPKKCLLFQREVPFLGHIVSQHGVRTDPQKVSAVEQWPTPRNVRDVRSFLGLCTYYRRFVQNFASIAAPLHRLTKKGQQFQWTEECQTAFDNLKGALVRAPVLPYPDPTLPYIVDCDASAEGIGAVLSQEKVGKEFVVAYYSRKFSKPERNY